MAEQYPIGVTELRYRATSFKESLDVRADIVQPDSIWQYDLAFTEIGGGLYFKTIDFNIPGVWTALFYENGIKRTSQNFLIQEQNSNMIFVQSNNNQIINRWR